MTHTVKTIADPTPKPWKEIEETYPLNVDYDQKIEDAVADGKYDYKNDDITSKNFPTSRKGSADIVLHLVHFNRNISSDDVILELDKLGLRPAETHEELAFGAAHPDIQRQFPIVALGSVWQDRDGDRYVPCLFRVGSERSLYLDWFGNGWSADCRFAAVPKVSGPQPSESLAQALGCLEPLSLEINEITVNGRCYRLREGDK